MTSQEPLSEEQAKSMASVARLYSLLSFSREAFYAIKDRKLPEALEPARRLRDYAKKWLTHAPPEVRKILGVPIEYYIRDTEKVLQGTYIVERGDICPTLIKHTSRIPRD
ncbi:MAG: hypothetical protein KJ718_05770 [Nanoarchaeota archaeon]|nr:hypothetical protein [Nanoarchaeota archaeon]